MLTSTAISQKGFMLIFTFVISTPLCDATEFFQLGSSIFSKLRLLYHERTLAIWQDGVVGG